MHIKACRSRGRVYYAVVQSRRRENRVFQEYLLKLGRLDTLTETRRLELENKISAIGGMDLLQKFHDLLYSIGYSFPSPVSTWNIREVYSYGPELALHKVCEEIDLVDVVNRYGYKGGSPELGKLVEIMAIARNCDPSSYFQVPEWYSRSALPFFLKLPREELTYNVVIRALNYLQPGNTIQMQISLYENIRRVYSYECERLDIDITSTYFEGDECVLAEFGYSREHRSDRPQIIIAFIVDQKGVLVTHKVWPGNQSDVECLKPIDRKLRIGFGLDAPRIIDRGMATWENLEYMDRRKERYLAALRAEVKSLDLLDKITLPREEWADVGEGEKAISVILEKRRLVILWNSNTARINREERERRVERAEEELKQLQESITKGSIKSRKQRDESIGYILKNYGVRRYLHIRRKRKGFQFEVERTEALEEAERYDGYQVFVTTEMDLTEKEVVESYRIRDQIEKAIRTLKNVLGLHPQYVRTQEHVLGNIFVCATAFQLRSILRMKLKDRGIDMSIEEAMRALERLKAVHIAVGKEGEIQVYRKLSALNGKTRTLIEVFNMAENKKLPEVE